jgi:tetratricopeptide (TPR) repeat protein
MDRIAILESFVAKAPDDPFPRYGLAMELNNRGRIDDALAAFAELVRRSPDYLPTYLMYGNALAAAEKPDEARAIYERGVAIARGKRDGKTAGELEAALDGLSG